jgi:hypothetical protein
VVKHLISKHEAVSSNPSTANKQTTERGNWIFSRRYNLTVAAVKQERGPGLGVSRSGFESHSSPSLEVCTLLDPNRKKMAYLDQEI